MLRRPSPVPRTTAREAILRNEENGNPLSDHELAELLGIKLQSLQVTKTRMRKQGLIARPPLRRQRHLPPRSHAQSGVPVHAAAESIAEAESATPSTPDPLAPPADFALDRLAGLEPNSELRNLQWLTWIIEHGPLQMKIAAIGKMDDLRRAKLSGIGPREPLTEPEIDDRLACLLIAVGPARTLRASKLAFPEEAPINASPVTENEPGSPDLDLDRSESGGGARGIAPPVGETPDSGPPTRPE